MQAYIRDFTDGIRAYGEALRIVRRLHLWKYLWIPGLISLLFAVLVVLVARQASDAATAFIADNYPWERGAAIIYRISGILAAIMAWGAALILYKYLVLILTAPFMGPLSERVERHLTGRENARAGSATAQILRGIRVSLRNLSRELLLTLLIVIVTAVLPFLSVFSGPVVFMLQAFYAGFGNMDFTLERHFDLRRTVVFVKRYPGLAAGNGIPFIVLLAIPVIGVFLAPGLATIAGTVEVVKRLPGVGGRSA